MVEKVSGVSFAAKFEAMRCNARARAVIQSISSPLLGDHIIDMPRLTSECAEKVLRDMRHEPDISSFILFSLTMHGLTKKIYIQHIIRCTYLNHTTYRIITCLCICVSL